MRNGPPAASTRLPGSRNQKTTGHWNTYDIQAEGDHLLIKLNDKVTVDAHDSKNARGTIALQNLKGEGEVRFRNLKLKPLGLKTVFNGKDLSGWKEIPGQKSVYSVTPEGWLNVKNGNGDLQSEAEYGDFVFQLDIFSNGTASEQRRILPRDERPVLERVRNPDPQPVGRRRPDQARGLRHRRHLQPATGAPGHFKRSRVVHDEHVAQRDRTWPRGSMASR